MNNPASTKEQKVSVTDHRRLKDLLDHYASRYNRPEFIEGDPISIPHRFSNRKDIEISAFWTAVISWGQRKTIIQNADRLMKLMDGSPYDFVVNHKETDRMRFEKYCHRTFQYTDSLYFLTFLQQYYRNHESLEQAFAGGDTGPGSDIGVFLENFHYHFFSLDSIPARTRKHIPRPSTGSRCKRLLMFLRWMVRSDHSGVDFGLWKKIGPEQLFLPLDVHVERSARRLGLLERKALDWKAVEQLSGNCSTLNPEDPALYDYALFGLSLEEKSNMPTKQFVYLQQSNKTFKT